jgi:hypothetical protein
LLDLGKYAVPVDAFGMEPTVKADDKYTAQYLFEGDNYLLVTARPAMMGGTAHLVIDRDDPAAGISATGGPEGKPGLFTSGVKFTPMYIHDNRLVGYMQALDIVDNTDAITNPDLKALAATLKEDSNPVIVVAKLKK